MKICLGLLLLFTGINSFAQIDDVRVSEFYCTQIDPDYFGDICVLSGASNKKRYNVLLNFKHYSKYAKLLKPGDIVHLNTQSLEGVSLANLDYNVQNEYWNLFGYVRSNIFHVDIPGAITKISLTQELYDLEIKCHNHNIHVNNFLYGYISVVGRVSVKTLSTYELSNIELDYQLKMDESSEEIWSEGLFMDKDYSVMNMYHYNPFKYKNHIKFPGLYSHKGVGEIDLIIPAKTLDSLDSTENFTGIIILTAINDHAGGSVQVKCSATKR